jgi:hypothetical protein
VCLSWAHIVRLHQTCLRWVSLYEASQKAGSLSRLLAAVARRPHLREQYISACLPGEERPAIWLLLRECRNLQKLTFKTPNGDFEFPEVGTVLGQPSPSACGCSCMQGRMLHPPLSQTASQSGLYLFPWRLSGA